MKKNLLLILLMLSSVSFLYSQNPCVLSYQINNGGGNCPDQGGLSPTGTVTITLDGPLGAIIPAIAGVTDITDPNNPQVVADVHFGPGNLLNNGNVKFCYYTGPANSNNLQGNGALFLFILSYLGSPCSPEQGALPVSFRAFTASRSSSIVALKWTTATETNNSGFEIQRSIGNGSWQTLSFIASQAVGGNSASDLNYTYSDVNLTKGISQYRIKQIDIDKRTKYSEIRAVRGEGQKGKTIVYPNPSFDGKVNVVFEDVSGSRDISLMDMNGRIIKQMKGITNNNISFENLLAGIYTVKAVNNDTGEQEVQKFVVNKR